MRSRQIGGRVQISNSTVRFQDGRCAAASGNLSSDILQRAQPITGIEGGDLSGSLRCDNGMLSIPLQGASGNGDILEAEVRIGPTEPWTLTARIETESPELTAILLLNEFESDGAAFTYRQTVGQSR